MLATPLNEPLVFELFRFDCISGFGHDLAVRLDELGFTVFAGCLRPSGKGAKKLKSVSSRNLHIVPVDVGNDESVAKAHQYVVNHLPKNGKWLWCKVRKLPLYHMCYVYQRSLIYVV